MKFELTPAIREAIRDKLRDDIARVDRGFVRGGELVNSFDDRKIDWFIKKCPPKMLLSFRRMAEGNTFLREVLPEGETFRVIAGGEDPISHGSQFVLYLTPNLQDWFCSEHYDELKNRMSFDGEALTIMVEDIEECRF
jgi:hypothetical protein